MDKVNDAMRVRAGFTIVELLIVVVVIAILAAITIVAYNGIQTSAKNSQAIAAVGEYVKGIRMYNAMNQTVPMTVNSVQCFNGQNCWSGTDVAASGVLRTNLLQVLSALPDFPSGYTALITYGTTGDTVNGGNYVGWYVLYTVPGSDCPAVSGLRYLNANTSSGIRNCRAELLL